jgi:vitamin B12 transporter
MEKLNKSIINLLGMILILILSIGSNSVANGQTQKGEQDFLISQNKSTKNKGRTSTSLDEMVVTAGRAKEMKKDVSSYITVINQEKINLSPATNLDELLAEQNVGFIKNYVNDYSSVGLRAFKSNAYNDLRSEVLILVDGRRAGTGNTAKIMTKNIERIEIIRGPASVQYGSSAMGGVINVITKQGREKPSAFVEGKLGSFGYEEGSFGVSGKTKGFDFSGTASRSTMDDYDTGDDEHYDNTGYHEKNKVSMNLGYNFLSTNRIGLTYYQYDANKIGDPDKIIGKDSEDYTDRSHESYDFIYTGATEDDLFSWKARYFNLESEDSSYEVTNGKTEPGFASDIEPQGAQAQLTWNPGYCLLTAGFDWVYYENNYSSDPKKSEYDNPAGFLLGKIRFFDERLVISGGVRYDEFEVDMKRWGDTEEDEQITPRLGLAYLILDNLKLRINYGQGFRMTTGKELVGDYVNKYGYHYIGNSGLDPEESDTYEIGMDMYYGAFDSSLTFFYTDYEDKIETYYPDKKKNPKEKSWHNIDGATISGFEGEFSYDLAPLLNCSWQIKPFLNFTYLTEFENEETDRDLEQVSEYRGACGLIVSDLKGFSTFFNLAYTDHFKDYSGDRHPGFAVANLSVEKRLLDWGEYGDLKLRGEVKNLFDREYSYNNADDDSYLMPGRSFIFGANYTF